MMIVMMIMKTKKLCEHQVGSWQAIQGHSRSQILVPIESGYATSYY